MVTDQQVKKLMRFRGSGRSLRVAAAKAGMDEKTARKYLASGKLPSSCQPARTWRTREDPFEDVWDEMRALLKDEPGLQAKTLFADLQYRYPGRFADGQLRTMQRRVKAWRALEGPPKEVFFPQRHRPGAVCQSDFTHLTSLGVTIGGQPFAHLLYHFVLTYSNWEAGTVCFSESFESLSEGLQNALWKLGKVPETHQSDRMSSAVHKLGHPEAFTARYRALLRHYDLKGRRIQAGKANENGDVEQRHRRLKEALDQALMLRGSRDFEDRRSYEDFLNALFAQLNAGRQARLAEELAVMVPLPASRQDAARRVRVRVGPSSTIRVLHNTYSVPSQFIGEQVDVHVLAETLEVWYAQRRVATIPRLRGESKHRIHYRHIIDWLVRKPGAFANYRYREDLFPTSRFRMAYDGLVQASPLRASREYVEILYLAAHETETGVDAALQVLLAEGAPITASRVEALVQDDPARRPVHEIAVEAPDLDAYDALLEGKEVAA